MVEEVLGYALSRRRLRCGRETEGGAVRWLWSLILFSALMFGGRVQRRPQPFDCRCTNCASEAVNKWAGSGVDCARKTGAGRWKWYVHPGESPGDNELMLPRAVARTGARPGGVGASGGASQAEVKALTADLNDMRLNVEGLEKERDFYFNKVRGLYNGPATGADAPGCLHSCAKLRS